MDEKLSLLPISPYHALLAETMEYMTLAIINRTHRLANFLYLLEFFQKIDEIYNCLSNIWWKALLGWLFHSPYYALLAETMEYIRWKTLFRQAIILQQIFFFPIHRQFRTALPLSKHFMGVLSGGEIHCLRRLRNEGYPEFLSRS